MKRKKFPKPATSAQAEVARAAFDGERRNWSVTQKFKQRPDLWIAARARAHHFDETECSSRTQADDVVSIACWRVAIDAVTGASK